MACITKSNSNNFVKFRKVNGSISLENLQQNGIPDTCNNIFLAPPKNLTAKIENGVNVVLNWENVSGESRFRIERSNSPDSGYSFLANVARNVTTYTDTTATREISQYYRVRAGHESGSSAYSNIASVLITGAEIDIDTSNTSSGSSTSTQFKLPLESSGAYRFTVDWGDGNEDLITSWDQPEVTHTYGVLGSYTLKVYGQLTGWRFNNTGDKLKVTDFVDWGDLNLGNSGDHFNGCTNLVITAGADLDMEGVTSLSSSFRNCTSLTSFPLIDTSNVTDFTSTWFSCTGLTSFPLIDVSSATELSQTWRNCQSITSFPLINTSTITNFFRTWRSNEALTSFPLIDTSNATSMEGVWDGCIGLLTFPLIDTSNTTTLDGAWESCLSLTSFPAINLSSVTGTGADMLFDTNIGTVSYDALLIATDGLSVNNNVTLDVGSAQYTLGGAAETARTNLINDHSWTINDGGGV